MIKPSVPYSAGKIKVGFANITIYIDDKEIPGIR
jgi:hypothetical protein